MKKDKDIITYNAKGKLHGYQLRYIGGNIVRLRGVFKYNKFHGYVESYSYTQTRFHIR